MAATSRSESLPPDAGTPVLPRGFAPTPLTLRDARPMLVLPPHIADPPNDIGLRRLLDGQPARRVAGVEVSAVAGLGDAAVGSIATADLERLRDEIHQCVGQAKVLSAHARRKPLKSEDPGYHGRGAANNFVEAAKKVFGQLRERGLIATDPARNLRKLPTPDEQKGLSPAEVDALRNWVVVARRDVELDLLIVDLMLHTAMREQGLIDLRVRSLDPVHCFVVSVQKGSKIHRDPVRRSILQRALALAAARGSVNPDDPLLPRLSGAPINAKYVIALFGAFQSDGPFTCDLQVTAHYLRHTLLKWLDVTEGERIAATWSGHSQKGRGSMSTYVGKASTNELIDASERLLGPLRDVPYDPNPRSTHAPLPALTVPSHVRHQLNRALDGGRAAAGS